MATMFSERAQIKVLILKVIFQGRDAVFLV